MRWARRNVAVKENLSAGPSIGRLTGTASLALCCLSSMDPSASVTRSSCIWIPNTTYRTATTASPVRICVIDLGTNSFHAVLVDTYPNGSFKVVDRMKDMVRLGDSGLVEHRLSDEAMERAMKALRRIHLLSKGWEAREFLAFATSAIREATNGGAFIERVRREIGLRIRPISGEQEARLIFQGVRRAVDMPDPSLIMDVGGGSVEFIVVVDQQPVFATSLKLGAARLTEQFVTTDPLSDAERATLREHIDTTLAPVIEACATHNVETVVGSSGTMKSLAVLCCSLNGAYSQSVFQRPIPTDTIRSGLRWVLNASRKKRMDHAAIDARRADQIGAGAALVNALLDHVPSVRQMRVSPNALREGMVVHFIDQNYTRIRNLAPFRDVRRRSVHEIAFRFQWEERHAQHVAATACALFDVCRPLYDGPDTDAELLEYAALLHDIGYHISHAEHHLHSGYLIANADLQGFQNEEVRILSLVTRYHRAEEPSPQHQEFGRLSRQNQQRVYQLAALLRIAEALDRSHFQNVMALKLSLDERRLHINVETKGDPQLEVWAVENESALFRRVFGRKVDVNAATIPVRVSSLETPVSVSNTTPQPNIPFD